MAPSLLIKLGFEAPRRLRFIVARIAPWTRRSRAAAVAGALALERSIRMVLTDPATVIANGAVHSSSLQFPPARSVSAKRIASKTKQSHGER